MHAGSVVTAKVHKQEPLVPRRYRIPGIEVEMRDGFGKKEVHMQRRQCTYAHLNTRSCQRATMAKFEIFDDGKNWSTPNGFQRARLNFS